MENKKEEQIIYIKDLIFAALYCWKTIVVIAVLLAIFLGGYKAFAGWKEMQSYDSQTTTAGAESEINLAVQQVSSLEKVIEERYAYLQNAPLMQLDPYNHYEVRMTVFAATGFEREGLSDIYLSQAVLNAYRTMLSEQATLDEIGQIMHSTGDYVAQLVSFQEEGLQSAVAVKVKCNSGEEATKIADILTAKVSMAQPLINAAVAPHEMQILETSVVKQSDIQLADAQRTEITRLTELLKALSDANDKLKAVQSAAPVTITKSAVVKKAILFAVIGGVAGAFLTACVIWVLHITSTRVYSARTLVGRTGIKLLGCVESSTEKSRLNGKLRKLEGRCSSRDYTVIATDISCRAKSETVVLLTGSTEEEDRRRVKEALEKCMPGVQVTESGCMINNAQTLEALARCDAVVLVEKCGNSRYTDVLRQIETIADYNKQLIGCVLLDG